MRLTLLRSAHLPMNRRCCSALTERGPFFRALHRMHRRLSCRKSTPDAAAAFAGSKCLRASCVRTCWMRWTSTRRRSLSHCGGTNSMRTRATYVPPLRSQPNRSQISFTFRWIVWIRYAHTSCPCPCVYYMPQRSHFSSSAWLCACSVWLCARARRGTYTLST